MNKNFSVLEVTQMAINIEKQGYEFYMNVAKNATSEKAKAIFLLLAEQEKKHIDMFTNLSNVLKDMDSMDDSYLFDENVSLYIEALTDNEVFKETQTGRVSNIISSKEAIKEGIQAEKNSILFYTEILNNTKATDVKSVLELLIEEEKKHVIDLTQLAKTL